MSSMGSPRQCGRAGTTRRRRNKPTGCPLKPGLEVQYGTSPVRSRTFSPPLLSSRCGNHRAGERAGSGTLPQGTGTAGQRAGSSADYAIKPRTGWNTHPVLLKFRRYIVTDIFRGYEPDEAFTARGGYILVNGVRSGFTTPIKHGDVVELVPYGAETANS